MFNTILSMFDKRGIELFERTEEEKKASIEYHKNQAEKNFGKASEKEAERIDANHSRAVDAVEKSRDGKTPVLNHGMLSHVMDAIHKHTARGAGGLHTEFGTKDGTQFTRRYLYDKDGKKRVVPESQAQIRHYKDTMKLWKKLKKQVGQSWNRNEPEVQQARSGFRRNIRRALANEGLPTRVQAEHFLNLLITQYGGIEPLMEELHNIVEINSKGRIAGRIRALVDRADTHVADWHARKPSALKRLYRLSDGDDEGKFMKAYNTYVQNNEKSKTLSKKANRAQGILNYMKARES